MTSPMISVRSSFLASEWSPYPPSPVGGLPVDVWLASGSLSGWVCGRARFGERSTLASGTASLEFAFAEGASGPRPPVLADGDLIAVLLERAATGGWLASRTLLLAPALGPAEPAGLFPIARAEKWSLFTSAIRSFFTARRFVEARTPTLVPSPGTEPYLDAFGVEYVEGANKALLHLPTSPEFHLKRLLAGGWSRVFELKDCFRNGEVGESHQPEFAMLEWYRAYESLTEIVDDAAELITECAKALGVEAPRPARTTTVRALFQERCGYELRPDTTESDLRALCGRLGIGFADDDSWDDLFFRVFLERIERDLGQSEPVIVRDYPPRLAALARLGPEGWADRAEIYWKGLELANGFHELNDPDENAKRFAQDRDAKIRLGRQPFPEDTALMGALRAGMPPAGGIALGVDRLFMALTGIGSIAETRAFPFERPLTRRLC